MDSPQLTTGLVTSVLPADNSRQDDDQQRCRYTVTYRVAAVDYSFEESAKAQCPYTEGQQVPVVFSATEPESGRLDQPAPWSAWLALVAGVVVGGLAARSIARRVEDKSRPHGSHGR